MNNWIVTSRSFSFEDWKNGLVEDFREKMNSSDASLYRNASILSSELNQLNGITFFLLSNDLELSKSISSTLKLNNRPDALPENISPEIGNSDLVKLYRNGK